jgi:hypothetical protein
MASESDDDVAESQDNNYTVWCMFWKIWSWFYSMEIPISCYSWLTCMVLVSCQGDCYDEDYLKLYH